MTGGGKETGEHVNMEAEEEGTQTGRMRGKGTKYGRTRNLRVLGLAVEQSWERCQYSWSKGKAAISYIITCFRIRNLTRMKR